ncbi:MAG: CHAT domain-containing protein [Myxococcota bacterium]
MNLRRRAFVPRRASLLVWVLVISCSHEDPVAPLTVELAGCGAIRDDGTCLLSPGGNELRLFVEAPMDAEFEVLVDGAGQTFDRREVANGHLLTLHANGSKLRIDATGGGPTCRREFALEALPSEPSLLQEARRLRGSGALDEAEEALAVLEQSPTTPAERAHIASLRARVTLSRGEHVAAREQLERSAELLDAAGLGSLAVNDEIVASFIARSKLWDFDQARTLLQQAEEKAEHYPEGRARLRYHFGRIALEVGDVRSAAQAFRTAEAAAEQLGADALVRMIVQADALRLQSLGRFSEALARLESLRGNVDAASACVRGDYHNDVGWALLLDVTARAPTRSAPTRSTSSTRSASTAREHFERAMGAYSDCRQPDVIANVELNLALLDLHRGDYSAARSHVERASDPSGRREVAAWRLEILGRLALSEGQPEAAARHYRELLARSEPALVPAHVWKARLGLARTLEYAGDTDGAIAELRHASVALEGFLAHLAIDDEPRLSLARWDEATRRLVRLLVEDGRSREALDVAWAGYARTLRRHEVPSRLEALSAASRERWQKLVARYWETREGASAHAANAWTVPAEELAAWEAQTRRDNALLDALLDEAMTLLGTSETPPLEFSTPTLVYVPTDDGWLGFLATDNDVTVRSLDALSVEALDSASPANLSRDLVQPFEGRLSTGSGLRIVAVGALSSVDFHALPFGGRPLGHQFTVSYPLASASARSHSPTRVLVVADPTGDLRSARREGEQVATVYRDRQPTLLLGDAVTLRAMTTSLSEVDLLHFAGHGRFDAEQTWQSALPLGDHDALEVPDVLALPAVPAVVVLSACEAARSGRSGLSLARAFVMAGSEVVIAPSRQVSDADAAAFSVAFHRRWAQADALDPVEILRQTQIELQEERPAGDWMAYRAVVR